MKRTKNLSITIIDKLKQSYGKNELVTKVCDDIFLEYQKEFVKNPPVYLSKTKDMKYDTYYLNGKTYFPLNINKNVLIKVYVGKFNCFSGTDDERGKKICKDKIIKRLQKEYSHLF